MPQYGIVDVDARLVERWRPDDERPELVTDVLLRHPETNHAPLRVDLPAFFAQVHGESEG